MWNSQFRAEEVISCHNFSSPRLVSIIIGMGRSCSRWNIDLTLISDSQELSLTYLYLHKMKQNFLDKRLGKLDTQEYFFFYHSQLHVWRSHVMPLIFRRGLRKSWKQIGFRFQQTNEFLSDVLRCLYLAINSRLKNIF